MRRLGPTSGWPTIRELQTAKVIPDDLFFPRHWVTYQETGKGFSAHDENPDSREYGLITIDHLVRERGRIMQL